MAQHFAPAAVPKFQQPPWEERYICQTCCKILRPPVSQGPCGHRFCVTCADDMFFRRDVINCPVCDVHLTKRELYPDFAIARELMNMNVHCSFSNNQNGCDRTMKWKDLASHEEECKFNTRLCTFSECPVVKKVLQVEEKVETVERSLARLHLKCESIAENTSSSAEVLSQCAVVKSIQETVGEQKHVLEELRKSVYSYEDRLTRVEQQMKLFERKAQFLLLENKEMQSQMQHRGPSAKKITWTITNYSSRKENVRRNVTPPYIQSIPFYTSPNGFNMCLRFFPNGRGEGKDTHVSLYFVLLEGGFDEFLSWPFSDNVSISIVDKDSHCPPINWRFDKNDVSLPSQQDSEPASFKSAAYGNATFCTQNELDEAGYINDDTLLITAYVSKTFATTIYTEFITT